MRCGTTGLRPTFGRVARTGAMALCWSLDKIGPIARTVEDCAMVLDAIRGPDSDDPGTVEAPFEFDGSAVSMEGVRIGYAPSWFEGGRVSDVDRQALEGVRALGAELVEIDDGFRRDYDFEIAVRRSGAHTAALRAFLVDLRAAEI